ncbi:MAG: hypothetical protein PHY43_05460 [Verrucomicrobiales bacterium]|nr:hypothetical protein [Verrucomicrobiales bacterium]
MNNKMSRNNFIRSLWLVAVLFAAAFLMPALRAQPAERVVHGRYLFIFDTSSDMKKRATAVEKSLNTMLATSMSGQMHKGDTIGVWTFSKELHPGDFPLQAWNPEMAVNIASNLTQFVHSRKYGDKTRFEALQPLLNRVVQSSERLTVLIFCDGTTKITGTTFDAGINQLFETNAAAQKKAREPFVVVLRSQRGKYIGCTVTYAPQMVSFPQFPPLPEPPPAPKPEPVPVPVPVPATVVPSIIITGTKVEASQPAVTNSLPIIPLPTNPPRVIEPAPETVAPTNTTPTNTPAIEPAVTPAVAPAAPTNPPASTNDISPANQIVPTNALASTLTNVPVLAAETPVAGGKKLIVIGAVLFVALGVLTTLAIFYFRRPGRRSLISDSMHDK